MISSFSFAFSGNFHSQLILARRRRIHFSSVEEVQQANIRVNQILLDLIQL
jgi:hypothetical protein